jgi:hypothetical protein
MPDSDGPDPLEGISDSERRAMARLMTMPPQHHRDAEKPLTPKGKAQRRRRENERIQNNPSP